MIVVRPWPYEPRVTMTLTLEEWRTILRLVEIGAEQAGTNEREGATVGQLQAWLESQPGWGDEG